MTYSIVARDQQTGMLGAAVASTDNLDAACAVRGRGTIGVVAIQGAPELRLVERLLGLLENGRDSRAVLAALRRGNVPITRRQILMVDARGNTAAYSGPACAPDFGHTEGTDHVAGGEGMDSPNVVGAMSLSFERSGADPLWERLLLALQSGERVGGDSRGTASILLVVYESGARPVLELRVEHHPTPMEETRRQLVEWLVTKW